MTFSVSQLSLTLLEVVRPSEWTGEIRSSELRTIANSTPVDFALIIEERIARAARNNVVIFLDEERPLATLVRDVFARSLESTCERRHSIKRTSD
jgi:hypothetical protein